MLWTRELVFLSSKTGQRDMAEIWGESAAHGDALSKLQYRNGASRVPGHPPRPLEQDLGNIPCQWWGSPSTCHGPMSCPMWAPCSWDHTPHSAGPCYRVLHASGVETTQQAVPSATSRRRGGEQGHQGTLTQTTTPQRCQRGQWWCRWGTDQEMGPEDPKGSWSGPGSPAPRTPLSRIHPLPHTPSP